MFVCLHLFWTIVLLLCLIYQLQQFVIANNSECVADFWPQQQLEINSHLNVAIPACDDFYEHACGNWQLSAALLRLRAHDTLSGLKAKNKRVLLQHLQQLQLLTADEQTKLPQHTRNVLKFFESCLGSSVKSEEAAAVAVYADRLKQLSNWPILNANFLETTANESFNWQEISAQLRLHGVQSMWQLRIEPNWQAAEQKIFYIMPQTYESLRLGKTADADFEHETYVKYIMLALGVRIRQAKQIAQLVLNFEKGLLALVENEDSTVLKEPQTLALLLQQLPELKLHEYFKTLWQQYELPLHYEQQLLIVADAYYLRKLARFLRNTNAELIGTFLLVRFMAHFEVATFTEHLTYGEQNERCLQQLHILLPNELSLLFLQLQHKNDSLQFLQQTREQLNGIFAQLKLQFEQLIANSSIFEQDDSSKEWGLQKIRAMRLLLPELQNIENFDFEITENYAQNLLQLSQHQVQQQLRAVLLNQRRHERAISSTNSASNDPAMGPLSVNAYYRLKKNAIELPIGILPLFNVCHKSAHNYGSFFYIISHELMHGFDYDGFNYDQAGNIANNWSAKTIIRFGVKSSCYLTRRYENAYLKVNENFADSEGLRLALQALNETMGVDDISIPDLQQFFISFAQTWCGEQQSDSSSNSLHGMHRERVNNAVRNFPEFAHAFACSAKSDMNPAEKCKIW